MGVNYYPSDKDVKKWIKMADTNKDGFVDLQEYEALILKGMLNAGFKIEWYKYV